MTLPTLQDLGAPDKRGCFLGEYAQQRSKRFSIR